MRIYTSMSLLGLFFFASFGSLHAQNGRFQQAVSYRMEVDLDVNTHRYQGKQALSYTNNSPDTLTRVFYHLYYNAFQPGSSMDVRSRTISDPDSRVKDRISKLSPEEIGFIHATKLSMNGKALRFQEVGTVLEVELAEPILPHSTVEFDMSFEGQVPLQVRRSGRDSEEGVRYSMSQWYPKMANYDEQGWHANPYVAREFYGIWGDFDVKITLDKSYTIGGTGYLQNPNQIGHGYEDQGVKVPEPKGKTLTWHFVAPKVHDFMWAADDKYKHDKIEMATGITVHHFYIPGDKTTENWEKLKEYTPRALDFLSKNFGQYPYKQFSVVQGGDGGMEYAMSTLITGQRSLPSLVGVMVHEMAHSWFHGVLASNESLYPWMDEGFTSYASNLATASFFPSTGSPQRSSYGGYFRLVKSGLEEPLSTHSDHYQTNSAYSAAAYSKGAVFLAQLGYVLGEEVRDRGMLRYWNTWQFKHPNVNDLVRVMEKESGMELDWYKEYFVYSTKTIDYAVKEVVAFGEGTQITLQRVGAMPMPLDVVVTYKDGSSETIYLPLDIMRGDKAPETSQPKRTQRVVWPWTHPTQTVYLSKGLDSIKLVEIDPSKRLADVQVENNKVEF